VYGLTAAGIAGITVPVLILNGEYDNLATPFFGQLLYSQFTGAGKKVQLTVNKASHYMPWETASQYMRQVSLQWLRNTAINGRSTGRGTINTNGTITW
jgi:pimeloyl-ACP methyl ester carboxylesterase